MKLKKRGAYKNKNSEYIHQLTLGFTNPNSLKPFMKSFFQYGEEDDFEMRYGALCQDETSIGWALYTKGNLRIKAEAEIDEASKKETLSNSLD